MVKVCPTRYTFNRDVVEIWRIHHLMQRLPSFVKNSPRTRIVCTIGPATGNVAKARQLIRAGMSVARLNLSHGGPEEHAEYVSAVREAADQLGAHVGILADLPGPKYRIGTVDPELATTEGGRRGIRVDARDKFVLTAERVRTSSERGDGLAGWSSPRHQTARSSLD